MEHNIVYVIIMVRLITLKKRGKNLQLLDESYRPKINAVEIDINNSFKHEFAKFLCVYLLRKGYDPFELQDLIPKILKKKCQALLREISRLTRRKYPFPKVKIEYPDVVTEARFKNRRRADIFILDTGKIIEIETNKKVKKKGAITIYI